MTHPIDLWRISRKLRLKERMLHKYVYVVDYNGTEMLVVMEKPSLKLRSSSGVRRQDSNRFTFKD